MVKLKDYGMVCGGYVCNAIPDWLSDGKRTNEMWACISVAEIVSQLLIGCK